MRSLFAISSLIAISLLVWQNTKPATHPVSDSVDIALEQEQPSRTGLTNIKHPSPASLDSTENQEPLTEDEEYISLMTAYLSELLVKGRESDLIAHRTEIQREIRRINQLDVEESLAYWEILQQLPDDYYSEKIELSIALIENVAFLDPQEAISMILLHDEFEIDDLDYENVVRLWMDQEGTAVMNLYEDLYESEANFDLVDAMDAVYAEEAPLAYILEADPDLNDYLDKAVEILYLQQGLAAFDQILEVCENSQKIDASFVELCTNLRWEDQTDALKDFLVQHRYQASEDAVSDGAQSLLICTAENNVDNMLETMNWTLDQGMLIPEDSKVSYAIRRVCDFSPEIAQAMVDSLVKRTGTLNDEWQKVLERYCPKETSQDGYIATEVLVNTRVRTDLRDLRTPLSAVTEQFLKDCGSDASLLLSYTTKPAE